MISAGFPLKKLSAQKFFYSHRKHGYPHRKNLMRTYFSAIRTQINQAPPLI
ncbi:hypothetical protein KIS4809_0635 [Bacillus sp. ZZV12-4809]|nr:hypothetical protein KIS4809_0635 [Bacillus sp. ZZV12-4809]